MKRRQLRNEAENFVTRIGPGVNTNHMISRVIVADESVSALDVWVRGQVLDLPHELQEEMGSRLS
jgi:hypothetical protein